MLLNIFTLPFLKKTYFTIALLCFTIVSVVIFAFFNWITIDESIYTMQLAIFALASLSILLMLVFILPKLFSSFYRKQSIGLGYGTLLLVLLLSLTTAKFGVYIIQYNLPFFSQQLFTFLGMEIFILGLSTLVAAFVKANKEQQVPLGEIAPDKEDKEYLFIKGELRNESFNIPVEILLYIKSSDNYSEFYYISNDGAIQNTLLRLTLKSVEKQIPYHYIIRNHKSYIVNMHNVKSITGNANNAKLIFKSYQDIEIPLSRSKRLGAMAVLESL